MSLSSARVIRSEYRDLLAQGIDPKHHRKDNLAAEQAAANALKKVTAETLDYIASGVLRIKTPRQHSISNKILKNTVVQLVGIICCRGFKVANIGGRVAFLVSGDAYCDLEKFSNGELSKDPIKALESLSELSTLGVQL